MMKYLIISKVKDSFYTLPDERRMVLWGAAINYTEKLIKAHKMREVHHIPGWARTVSILEVDSAEEATRLSIENPMRDYMDIESYGMVEWNTYLKGLKDAFQQLAASHR
jgi:muconolactone delta-isomerase